MSAPVPPPPTDDEPVEVPPELAAIGYSGQFHVESVMDMTLDQVEEWRAMVPCLLPTQGWMALQVVDGPRVVLVRRDNDAIVEAIVRGGRRA